jgi:hypothetical protein
MCVVSGQKTRVISFSKNTACSVSITNCVKFLLHALTVSKIKECLWIVETAFSLLGASLIFLGI